MHTVAPAKSLTIGIIAVVISILLLSNVSGNDLDDRNNPPLTPSIPDGPAIGNRDIEYYYSSNTTDPDDDLLFYLWDWGDNSSPVWYGPYSSGETSNISHEWTELGTYQVRVKAKDNSNVESNWSEPLNVSIIGTMLYVGGSGPDNYTSIQDAIDAASDGDTVYVYNGTYIENIVIDKSLDIIGENRDTTIIEGNASYYLIEISSDEVKFSNFSIVNGQAGIGLSSNYNLISNNSIINCTDVGIGSIYDNVNNTIEGNDIVGASYGIYFWYSNNTSISGNSISDCFIGIVTRFSYDVEILDNYIMNNFAGLVLDDDNCCMVYQNHILNNNYSIDVCSQNNLIYHNNFIGNINGPNDISNINSWDAGYPYGGNYWDDYNGTDEYHGPHQNIPGGDGIGDTPYDIPGDSNQDRYPLMNPITTPPSFIWVDDNFNSSISGWNVTHFDSIQNAIDNVVENGTVYVFNGSYNSYYYESIEINKSIALLGEDKNTTIIDGTFTPYPTIFVSADGVTIKDFTIHSSESGYGIYNVSNHTNIINNIISSSDKTNTIENRTISYINHSQLFKVKSINSSKYGAMGITVINGNYNNISKNIISNFYYGIVILDSGIKNNIINNDIFSTDTCIEFYSDTDEIFTKNIVSGNNLSNSDYGIGISSARMNTFSYNSFFNNGMYIFDSYPNIIHNNTVNGRMLGYYYNISDEVITDDVGQIIIINSSNITIQNHDLSFTSIGVLIIESDNCTVQKNIFSNNEVGVLLSNSSNITVRNNLFFNIYDTGLYYSRSFKEINNYYHNTFVNNYDDAKGHGSKQKWNLSYPYGGNFWDKYNEIDINSGVNQSIPGADGIGDSPYNIWTSNYDYYPLMHPYGQITEIKQNWNFISLPTNLSVNTSEIIVFYNDTFISWQEAIDNGTISPYIFGWNRTLQSYQFDDTLIPGCGYWIYAPEECKLWTFNYERNLDGYITHLEPYWNIVGSSCDYPLDKNIMIINHNETDYNWTEAVIAGIISDFVFGWDRSSQSYTFADTFMPGDAYWMYAYQACTLKRT